MKSELHFCSFHFFRQPQDCPVLPPLRTRSRLNPCSAPSPTLLHLTFPSLVLLGPTNPLQARSRYHHLPRFARTPLLFSVSYSLRKRRVPSALNPVLTAPLAHWAPVCRSCSQASQKVEPNQESRPKSVSLLIWPTPPPPPENLSNTTRLAAGNGCGYLKVQARRRGRGKRAKLVGRFCLRPQ